jgi:HlyD family secretion protein
MRQVRKLFFPVLLLLAGCHRDNGPTPLLGTLEWDRIGVPAERSEPIVSIAVREGDSVTEGQLLLSLDPRRSDAQVSQAQAEVQRAEAALSELSHGARAETIAAAQSALAGANSTAANARRDRERAVELRAKGLNAQADLDRADTALKAAVANAGTARAQLEELTHGTRPEDIDQAQATLTAAQGKVEELRLSRARLDLRAPRAGRIDSLPFKLGDQPPANATLVSLLVGDAPYARVFVPEAQRAKLAVGARMRVSVQGLDTPFDATVQRLASEAAFTPYYALSGDDASRLTWRAEALLSGAGVKNLAAGLPVHAEVASDVTP